MMPEESIYGDWPLSGEIDILESRGNAPNYPQGGYDKMLSALHYGLATDSVKTNFHQLKRLGFFFFCIVTSFLPFTDDSVLIFLKAPRLSRYLFPHDWLGMDP
jgi:hypothetical protein